MNVLICDTSSQALITGVFTSTFKEVRSMQGRTVQHSEKLIPIVVELCKDAGIDTTEIDLFVCTRGPGSFTGLRIGMAAFKGMAFAQGKPIVSVSTLEAYASCIDVFEGAIVPAIDAKKQRWYLSAFSKSYDKELIRLMPDIDGLQTDILESIAPYDNILIVGPDAKAFETVIQNYSNKHFFVDMLANEAIASAIYKLGLRQYEIKGSDDIGQGPVYLRKSDAEIALEERMRNEKEDL